MSEKTLKPKWQCCECGQSFDDEEDAHDCCRPSVKMGYECPECGDWYDTMIPALGCCGDDADHEPSTADLEAMGQGRLFA